jgi:hypothetical protein
MSLHEYDHPESSMTPDGELLYQFAEPVGRYLLDSGWFSRLPIIRESKDNDGKTVGVSIMEIPEKGCPLPIVTTAVYVYWESQTPHVQIVRSILNRDILPDCDEANLLCTRIVYPASAGIGSAGTPMTLLNEPEIVSLSVSHDEGGGRASAAVAFNLVTEQGKGSYKKCGDKESSVGFRFHYDDDNTLKITNDNGRWIQGVPKQLFAGINPTSVWQIMEDMPRLACFAGDFKALVQELVYLVDSRRLPQGELR